jgi:hypothetical protein
MIWPFTTIAKLSKELKQTQENLRLVEGHLKALTNEIPVARERHTKLLETKQRLLDALRKELAVTKSSLTISENALHWKEMQLAASQKALAKAQKNDTAKDAKTGKFTKKATNV